MKELIITLATEFHDVLLLLLGAFVGVIGSISIWRLQLREERRKQRGELLVQAIQLSLSAGAYTRGLMYSKIEDLSAVRSLPENPTDRLMAIVMIHFPKSWTHVQNVHLLQQDLYGCNATAPNAFDTMVALMAKVEAELQSLIRSLYQAAKKDGIATADESFPDNLYKAVTKFIRPQ